MNDELPDYVPGTPIRWIKRHLSDGCRVVELMDGTLARVAQEVVLPAPDELERPTAAFLRDHVARVSRANEVPPSWVAFMRKLADDPRMRSFWEWLPSVTFQRVPSLRNAGTVAENILRATRMPRKPGNMTPAQREAYFAKVRHHALALAELLAATKFDNAISFELDDDELQKTLEDALYHWGDDEDEQGHVVAYRVAPDGRYQYHYSYPESALTETLFHVMDWTTWDDQWDGNFFISSAPIVQSNAESARLVFFTCTVHDWFARFGVDMPFPVLATVANVALDLGPDEQLDEETVRKQVRRHQARQAKMRAEHPERFADD